MLEKNISNSSVLNPSVQDLLHDNISRYSLVIATAKLARRIASDAEEHGEPIPENPVRSAVHMLYDGMQHDALKIVESAEKEDRE